MRLLLAICRKTTMLGLIVGILVASSFCHGGSIELTGAGECADCHLKNVKADKAFNGLLVTINCKLANGEAQTIGTAELDKQGKFRVSLPEEILQDGKLKEECYAQLHGASNAPCPAHDGMESSRIILASESVDRKHTLSTAGKIKFSSETCVSPSLWFFSKYPPPFPKFKPFPFPKPCPPFVKPLPPPVPVIPKPVPPPVPVIPKPVPPPVPVIPKPVPPPVPVVPKPLPPPPVPVVPIPYKPKPKPFPKPPLPPFPYPKPLPPFPYPKPLPPFPYPKPLPPFPYPKPLPPFPYPKPLPPIPKFKLPPIYKPPVTFPPIYKPKFPGYPKKSWPPLPFVPPHA